MKSITLKFLISITYITIFATFNLKAGNIDIDEEHAPRDGDKLMPTVNFFDISSLNVDTIRRTVNFSASLFEPTKDAVASIYVNDDTLSFVQFSNKHIFHFDEDEILYHGYENRASDFKLAKPVRVGNINTKNEQDILSEKWRGVITLNGDELLKKAIGLSTSIIQKGWKLIEDTDSILDVTYLRWEMDLCYFDQDVINPEASDSVNSERVSDLYLSVSEIAGERLLTRRELWFSQEARYPVLLRSNLMRIKKTEGGVCDTVCLSTFASHYPDEFQREDTGEEPPYVTRNTDSNKASRYFKENNSSDITGISIAEPSHQAGNINVVVSSKSGERELTLTLYSDSGIKISNPMVTTVGSIPQTMSIPVQSDAYKIVILFIESDTGTSSRKIFL